MKKNNKGMTLTELISAVAILGIIMVPITAVFNIGYRSYYEEDETSTAQHQAREAITSIMDDLRKYEYENSEYDASTGGLILIASATFAQTFSLSKNDITYTWTGTPTNTLTRTDAASTKTWNNISHFQIREDSSSLNHVIYLEIKAQSGKGREISIEHLYRRKALGKKE